MSKVKHFLRKLHIGDCQNQVRPPPVDPSPQTSSPQDTSSSPSDLPETTSASVENEGSNLGDNNFNFFEEEFQVQLALAISVSDPGQTADDPETAQINAAKQISLGCSPSQSIAEFLSLRYWNGNVINYDEHVMNGFYDVCGIDSNLVAQAKIPSLSDLEAISVSENVGYEVVLVNRAVDIELQLLEERVCHMSMECRALDRGLNTSFLVQKIADLIVEKMGGPVSDVEEMFRKWRARNYELRICLNSIILPLGCLDVGHSRHRALLFKVLADRIKFPCKLVKGSYYTGTDEGAVNLIKLDDGSEYIIDLMGAPGTLIPAEIPSYHHQNLGLDARSFANAKSSSAERARLKPSSMHIYESANATSLSSESTPTVVGSNGKGSSQIAGKIQLREDKFLRNNYEQSLVPINRLQQLFSHSGEEMEAQQFKSEPAEFISSFNSPAEKRVLFKDDNAMDSELVDLSENREALEIVCSDQPGADVIQNVQIDPVLNGIAEILWEDLQIGERIGIGSYGEVYRAEWNGTEVAVKKFMKQDISGDALAQFKCEVEIMLRLRHPNVVLLMGAVTRPPNMSILIEFLPRGSLYKLLHRPCIHIDEKRRIKMAIDVAKGMNYLHTSHPIIVHRDLKTPNLLVDKNWVVKVCDFGMSRLQHHTFLSSKSTAGTAEWMAPEVLRNEPSNEKSDVYSFGVILWELATLRVPWTEMNSMQVVGAVGFQSRHLDIPPTVDPLVADIIRDCWNRNSQVRPSFGQIITRLKCLHRLNVHATETV